MSADPILVVEVQKRPGELLLRIIDLGDELRRTWRPGKLYALNTVVQPRKANGFEYVVSTAGATASREPLWPLSAGATIADGSLVWTAQKQSASSFDAITGSATVTAPTGITATHVSTSATGDVEIALDGGTDGQDYEVVVQANTTGTQKVQVKVRVQVRS